ncbi:DMT family transporter [Ramlibacter sp. AN1015]|uniref:DMT family transporter n=1 Tax=Ramlibacter sp. AN1015 TaxID=3133428 RepID=UPI0030C39D4D
MSASGAGVQRRIFAGIALVMCACLFFAGNDTGSKVVVLAGVPVMLGVWARYVVQALATTAVALPMRGWRVLRTRHPAFQCLRGVLLLAGSVFVFASLRYLPVGEFTAIIMIAPLVVTLLGATVLKERVSPLRWLLVAGGFAGTLVIIRPGGEAFSWAMLLPLCQVACNAGFQILTSKLARTEDPLTMQLYTSWVGALLATVALPLVWTALPSPWLWALLAAMGVLAAVGHFLLILAFQRAPASTLTPYVYVQIGFAMLAGWLVFGHVPDGWSVLGMALIAACGVAGAWLTLRETRAARAPTGALEA